MHQQKFIHFFLEDAVSPFSEANIANTPFVTRLGGDVLFRILQY